MIKAVCFDLGDTLIAEETVIHDTSGRAITADVIDATFEVLHDLVSKGYKLAIIANDEDAESARNIINSTGLKDYFDIVVISGELGIEKPDTKIFKVALESLGVKAETAVMVGNRLDVDIVGANRSGMISVWFNWNSRYPASTNTSKEQEPDYTIYSLSQLLSIFSLL